MFKHLEEENLTYLNHMKRAWSISARLIMASIYCFVHGVIPSLFKTKASDECERICSLAKKETL